MPTIATLSRLDVLEDEDEIPLYSPDQEDTRKATLRQVAAYVQAVTEGTPDETIYSLPTDGSSVVVTALPATAGAGVWVQLTLTAPASSVTIVLPGIDDRRNGQEVRVTCTQAASVLVVNGNGAVVLGAPSSLSANGFFTLSYDSISNQWYRVG